MSIPSLCLCRFGEAALQRVTKHVEPLRRSGSPNSFPYFDDTVFRNICYVNN